MEYKFSFVFVLQGSSNQTARSPTKNHGPKEIIGRVRYRIAQCLRSARSVYRFCPSVCFYRDKACVVPLVVTVYELSVRQKCETPHISGTS